jgi:phosphocarrier protein HPr
MMDRITSIKIALPTMEDAKEFVALAADCPVEMDLRAGRYVVDAKSILGILSLGSREVLLLDIYGRAPEAFLEKLAPFMVQDDRP